MSVKVIGAIIGAVVAPIVLVLLVVSIYPKVAESWDFATPVLTMFFAAVALLGGAIAGALIAEALQRGDMRRAGILLVLSFLLVAAFPAWLATIWYGPKPVIKPRTLSQRDEWTQSQLAHIAQYGFAEQPGRSLAWSLRTSMRAGGAFFQEWRYYGDGEVPVGTNILAYRIADDDGWRYTYTDGPRVYSVFPDPRLRRDGPIFEVGPYDIYRRETKEAPAYSTDSSLAAILNIDKCITRFAESARAAGSWDGAPDSLGAAMAGKWTATEGCPELAKTSSPEGSQRWWGFEIRSGPGINSSFMIWPNRSSIGSPFLLGFMYNGRGFMRDASGNWQMRQGSVPFGSGDPPPQRCLFDLSVPCEGPPG